MPATDARRHLRHLVDEEGIPEGDATAFLEILARAAEEDPDFHAAFVAGLEERIERAAATRAREALARIAGRRESRPGPGEVRSLVESARRAAGDVAACRGRA